jgi:hypothetical protein
MIVPRPCAFAGALAALVIAATPRAHADVCGNDDSALVGPVLGIYWGRGKPAAALLGVEGGVGCGPERINAGVTNRGGEAFAYLELDPWLYVGASLGVGYGFDTGWHGLVGVWEGVPIVLPDGCSEQGQIVTLSIGYRYTGRHELYFAPKAGHGGGAICIH